MCCLSVCAGVSVHQYMIAWLYVYTPCLGLPAYICVFAVVCASVCVLFMCVCVCLVSASLWASALCICDDCVSLAMRLSLCLCVFQCIKSYACVLVSLPTCACPMHMTLPRSVFSHCVCVYVCVLSPAEQ